MKVQESQRRARETNLRRNEYWLGQLIGRINNGTDLRQISTEDVLTERLDPAVMRNAARRFFNMNNYVYVVLLPEEGRE